MNQPIAVLTGDVIASQRIDDLSTLYRVLDATLAHLSKHHGGRFERYRGDGFQLALPSAEIALDTALTLRAALIMHSGKKRWDARIAVAVGQDYWQANEDLATAQGPVFVASGKALDAISEGASHLALVRLGAQQDAALDLLIRYADELVDGWSPASAEVAYLRLWQDESQQAMAEKLGIRQPSVHKRLRTARWSLLADTLDFFRHRLAEEGRTS
ncbi:hypothetical protein [Halomonas sp. YLGW01]|uniref:hypothetical protein n=1 Tax=Halomonas sp. YLGW01 TaxID=2773308 RepID=UPI001783BB8E|nr:hypothetical protein [Halomonas sp. YLGW01]